MAPAGRPKPAGGRASGKAAASKRPPLPDVEDLLGGSGRIARVRDDLLGWYDANHRVLPWRWNPRSQLSREALAREAAEGRLPPPADLSADDRVYRVWVCEVMSQQTQLARVVDKFKDWIERWPDVRALARASEDEVQACWAGLGYYRRARALLEGAKKVVRLAEERERRKGETRGEAADRTTAARSAAAPSLFPSSAAELRRLIPGIGPYTASAIASNALDEPVAAVDGNVQRVLARLGAIDVDPASTAGVALFAALADRLLARDRPGCWNQALMELGAVVCLPRGRERCGECPLRGECRAHLAVEAHEHARKRGDRTSPPPPPVESYPCKAAKAARRETTVTAVVVRAPVLCEVEAKGSEGDGEAVGARGRARSAARGPSSAATIPKARPSAVLLARRPEEGLLGGLWEFPGVELFAEPGGRASGRGGAKGVSDGSRAAASAGGSSKKKRASKAADSSDEEILFASSEEEDEDEFGESSSASDSDASFDSDAAPWEEEEVGSAASRKGAARRKSGEGQVAGRTARVTRSQSASGSGSGTDRGTLLGFFSRKGIEGDGKSVERNADGDGKSAERDVDCISPRQAGSSDENAGRNERAARSAKGGCKRSPVAREAGAGAGSVAKLAKRAKRGGVAGASVKAEEEMEDRVGKNEEGRGRERAPYEVDEEAEAGIAVEVKQEAEEEMVAAGTKAGVKAEEGAGTKAGVKAEEGAGVKVGVKVEEGAGVKVGVKAGVEEEKPFAVCAPAASPAPAVSSSGALDRALCVAAAAAAAASAAAAAPTALCASEAAWLAALRAAKPVPLGSFVHVFSHIKMTFDVFLIDLTDQNAVGVPPATVNDQKAIGVPPADAEDQKATSTSLTNAGDRRAAAAPPAKTNGPSSAASAARASRWLRDADVAQAGLTSSVLKTWKLVQAHDAKAKAKAKNGIGRFFGKA